MKKYILHNLPSLLIFMIVKVINIGTVLGYSFLIRNLVNLAFKDNALELLHDYIFVCILYAVTLVIVYCLSSILYTNYFNKCLFLMKEDYAKTLLNSSYENVVCKDSSYYISTLCNDTMIIRNNFVTALFIMFDEGVTLIGAFICMLILSRKIALILLIVIVVVSLIPIMFQNMMNKANNKVSEALAKYTSGVKDILGGIEVIKIFHTERTMEERLTKLNNDVKNSNIQRDYKGTIVSCFASYVSNLIEMALIILTIYYVANGRMDIGSVSAILTLIRFFFQPIDVFSNQVACILGSSDIREKYMSIIKNYKQKDTKNVFHEVINADNLIAIENLTYSYDGTRKILNNLSLNIEQGKKYLIFGESGGGKSTLLKLIAKMYTEHEGTIKIRGMDYKEVPYDYICKNISYSQQRTYLFQGTIGSNIDLNNRKDEALMNECIKTCQLNEVISKLDKGIDTVVDEEVNRLSEGEKLRIGLARTLYAGSPLLLLDEITASLDNKNSVEIENMILNIQDKTILNICHKFSEEIASKYDQIVVIEHGEIVLMGNYKEISKHALFSKYKFGEKVSL
ncbi:MAG: ABC transporter ATP-binding protein [Eubacterium sp.]|nr:ABC transporter ATP-binding protein [Eubacterium sp.]